LVAAGSPVLASQARATDLRGNVVIQATHSYTRLVDIPRSFQFDFANDRMSGEGREYGFLLRPVGSNAKSSVWFDVAAGHCTTAACRNHGVYGVTGNVGGTGQQGVLPAGHYRLYVIADGQPVRIQLTFAGTGGTTVTAGSSWAPTLAQPAAADSGPDFTTYSAGIKATVGRYGGWVHLVSWKVLTAPKSANQVGACMYQGGPNWVAKPYQAPCTADGINTGQLAGEGADDQNSSGITYYSDFEVGGVVPPGALSVGAFNNGAVPATEAHTQVTLVSFPSN
jgi:hypothetical protein